MCKIRRFPEEAGGMKEHTSKVDLCAMPPEFANYLKTYSYDDEDQAFYDQGCQCPRLVQLSDEDTSCTCQSAPPSPSCGGILKTKRRSTASSSSSSSFYFGPDDDSGYSESDVFYADSESNFTNSLCSSPSSTPKKGNSRRVSFADEYGKDLVLVQVFSADSLPVLSPIGSPVTLRRNATSLTHMPLRSKSSAPAAPMPRITFEQPAADFSTFMKRIRENKVCLENIIVTEKSLFGTIKVENMCYAKTVFVRCTFDRWASHFDIPAVFIPCCESDTTINAYDTFSFETTLSKGGGVYHSIEFAVCLKAQGQEYWDNFEDQNYKILCDVWYDSADSQSDGYNSNEGDDTGCHGNKMLSPPPNRKYGDLPDFNSITGVSRSPSAKAFTRMRRNFCLY